MAIRLVRAPRENLLWFRFLPVDDAGVGVGATNSC